MTTDLEYECVTCGRFAARPWMCKWCRDADEALRALMQAAWDDDGQQLDIITALTSVLMRAEVALGTQVRTALDEGSTWQEIADALGVSRQAAHKRFASGER